jgi:hypothetical protein
MGIVSPYSYGVPAAGAGGALLVKGGVPNSISVLAGKAAGIEMDAPVAVGTKVYRVFGENNNPLGLSWTTVDPSTVVNYRAAAGLPNINTGRFVLEGTLVNNSAVTVRSALPLDGNPGGLNEVIIPNAQYKVLLQNASGVNPKY